MNLLGVSAILFVAGLAENAINAWHTRAVSHGKSLQSFLSGTIYVLVWYTALRFIVEYLNTLWIALFYALGSGIGSMSIVVLSKHLQHRGKNASPISSTSQSCLPEHPRVVPD